VPLCRGHHREVHRGGDELAWWTSAGIDPSVSARALWLETHPLPCGSEKPIGDLTEIRSGSNRESLPCASTDARNPTRT
jgi:hypothetical protein